MITEDYVSFETAKLLKGKGFQAKCTACYRSDLNYKFELVSGRINYCNPKFSKYKMIPPYNAPTLQTAMKWLRKEHGLFIRVTEDITGNIFEWSIYQKNYGCRMSTYVEDSYENACEAAIKYCLENLI